MRRDVFSRAARILADNPDYGRLAWAGAGYSYYRKQDGPDAVLTFVGRDASVLQYVIVGVDIDALS